MDDVLVIGAGVIGLTTAVCLADAGLRVRVVSEDPPARTTSAVAGGLWGRGPGVAEPAAKIPEWSAVTFGELAAAAQDASTGVRFARGREATRDPVLLEPLPQARSVRRCTADELPPGFRDGHWITVPVVDMPKYLAHLVSRFAGRLEAGSVRTMADVGGVPVVVNCTGSGARRFVPDETVEAIRGQHVVVRNPGLSEFFAEETDGDSWVSFFPHGDRVVLGGVADRGDWSLVANPVTAREIVRWCASVEPRLADAPVLAHVVGLRPGRPVIRVESSEVDGVRWVHNYGHGGMGVTLSWGCAREVEALLTA